MKAYNGFNRELKGRNDFQYEIGKTYEKDVADLWEQGFHAYEEPLEVLGYYPPGNQMRYCEVELDANEQKTYNSQRVGKRIKIVAEIGIEELVKAQVEYVKKHIQCSKIAKKGGAATAGKYGSVAVGKKGAATAGERGIATAKLGGAATAGRKGVAIAGNYGTAVAGIGGVATSGETGVATVDGPGVATTGNYGVATVGCCGVATSGHRGTATAGVKGLATVGESGVAATGERGTATAGIGGVATSGHYGVATSRGKSAVGEDGLAVARGRNVKVKGELGAVLVIAEEGDDESIIKECKLAVVDGKEIKPNAWYRLENGEFKEVGDEED